MMENYTSLVNVSNSNAPSFSGHFPLPLKVVYAIIGTAGIIGNGIVLVVFGRQRFLWNVTNLFMFNQSVADLLASVLLILNFLTPPITYSRQYSTREFLSCALWSSRFFYWSCQKVSTVNLLVLTLERYVAVVFPLTYRRQNKRKVSGIVLAFVWFFSFAFQACWLAIQRLEGGKCVFVWPNRATQIAYGLAVFVLLFIVPLVLMAFVYCSILKVLATRVGGVEQAPTSRHNHGAALLHPPAANQRPSPLTLAPRDLVHREGGTANQHQPAQLFRPDTPPQNYRDAAQRDVIRTLCIVGSVYALCWGPNMFLFLYISLGGKVDFLSWYYHTTVCLAFINVAVNPFIYTLHYAKFRRGFVRTFHVNYCMKHADGAGGGGNRQNDAGKTLSAAFVRTAHPVSTTASTQDHTQSVASTSK